MNGVVNYPEYKKQIAEDGYKAGRGDSVFLLHKRV